MEEIAYVQILATGEIEKTRVEVLSNMIYPQQIENKKGDIEVKQQIAVRLSKVDLEELLPLQDELTTLKKVTIQPEENANLALNECRKTGVPPSNLINDKDGFFDSDGRMATLKRWLVMNETFVKPNKARIKAIEQVLRSVARSAVAVINKKNESIKVDKIKARRKLEIEAEVEMDKVEKKIKAKVGKNNRDAK